MLTKLRAGARSCVCPVVLLVLSACTPLHSQRIEGGPPQWFGSFYSNVRRLVRRYYPQATSHRLANKIHFEYDTRLFVVHEPIKNGRWQDPGEQRGPKKDGILSQIEFRRGRYGGAALAPQVFEKPYFRVLLLAPYSAECDCHLYTHLTYPPTTDPKFLQEFQTTVDSFEKFLPRGQEE